MRADCKRPLIFVAAYRILMSLMEFNKRGTEIAARIMIMATTMINSIKEKPRPLFCVVECSISGNFSLWGGCKLVKARWYLADGDDCHSKRLAVSYSCARGERQSLVSEPRSLHQSLTFIERSQNITRDADLCVELESGKRRRRKNFKNPRSSGPWS